MTRIIDRVAKELGFSAESVESAYTMLYKINDNYDVEIRGRWARKNKDIRVYVWDISGISCSHQIIESHGFIKDVETLKKVVAGILEEYTDKPPVTEWIAFHKETLHS